MSGIIIDVIVLAIILIPTIQGFYKGLSTILYGILATIVAVVVTLCIYKPIAGVIIDKTEIDEYFAKGIYNILSNQNLEETGLIDHNKTNMSEQVVDIINKYLTEALKKSADSVFEYTSIKLSHLMVNLLTLIIMIIIFRIGLAFLKIVIDIISNLPIIKQIDKSGGMILGFLKGFLIVYIIFAVFSTFSPIFENSGILGMIQESKLGSVLYNNNLILRIISKGV